MSAPNMLGAILRDDRYGHKYTVVKQDGDTFSLRSMPKGKYTLMANGAMLASDFTEVAR